MANIPRAEEEIRAWLEMYESGMSTEEIGLVVGVSQSVVSRWLRTLPDYRPRPRGGKKAGESHEANRRTVSGPAIKRARLNPSGGRRRRGRL
jgi:transposase